jgi:formamidase
MLFLSVKKFANRQKEAPYMNGLSGINKSPDGVVIGLVQLRRPDISSVSDIGRQVSVIEEMVRHAKRGRTNIDILVFPEYSLNGGKKQLDPEYQCAIDGPEVTRLKQVCVQEKVWGCFSFMELNTKGNPYNSAIIIDDEGNVKLHYRKLHPLSPGEPWYPGDLGVQVCQGPRNSKIALVICHDAMFPEVARECAYKGAEIMIRIAAYSRSVRSQWHTAARADAFANLMYTASVCSVGEDGPYNGMGEGLVVDFEGTPIATGTDKANEVIVAEVRPALVREARIHWGAENNIYQLGHRGFMALPGGARDCPYSYMRDLVAGCYRLPWEEEVRVTGARDQ